MNAIVGMSDLLAATNLNSEQRKYVEIFQRASNSLMSVINNILDLSKIEAGHSELVEDLFELKEIIQEVADLIRLSSETKGLHFNVFLNSDLDGFYIGDATKLKQILINLLGNAIKFTAKGEVRLEINLNQYADRPGKILFSVIDTGIGISRENLNKLFNSFTQADNSITREFGGTGLGLSICKKLVESMDGVIWGESQRGVGSSFSFTIPLKFADAEVIKVAMNAKNTSENSEKAEFQKSLRILLVDDSEDNRTLINAYLKNSNHIISEAVDGQMAVEMVENNEYDLIFMDMQMPVKDGLTATIEIRAWESENNFNPVSIVALTAHVLKEEVEKCFSAGCSDYLSKPVSKKNLLYIIGKFAVVKNEAS
jgi:CheY-like chemotaxis protein/two-component sensor histidine kinase